jgi:CHAT domain-containing protein
LQRAAVLRKEAAADPRPGVSGLDAAAFYLARGKAAGQIGLLQQQLADLRLAVRLLRENGGRLSAPLLSLSLAERFAGNYREALNLRIERYKMASQAGSSLGDIEAFVVFAADGGDLVQAKRWVSESDRVRTSLETTKRRASAAVTNHWARMNTAAHASYLAATGQFDEAITAQRRAVAMARQETADQGELQTVGLDLEAAEFVQMLNQEQRKLAEMLERSGRLLEAEAEIRDGLRLALATYGRSSVDTAQSVAKLAEILSQQGRFAEAEQLGRAAEQMLIEQGSADASIILAGTRLSVADALVLQGKDDAALTLYDGVERALAGDDVYRRTAMGQRAERIIALYRRDRNSEALALADGLASRRQSVFGSTSYPAAEAAALVAVGLVATGNAEDALRRFREAIPILTDGRSIDDDAGTSARAARRRFLLERYIDMLAGLNGAARPDGFDPVGEAFGAADAARGQSAERAIGASATRAAATTPALADLVRQEQDLKEQIAARLALLASVASLPESERDEQSLQATRGEAERLTSARAALLDQIHGHFPAFASFTEARPASLGQIRVALRPNEAMIALIEGEKRSYVWAVSHDQPVAFAAIPLDGGQIRMRVAALRRAVDASIGSVGDIPDFDTALAYQLYQSLFAPVAAGWQGATTLLIVPDRSMAQLPASLLVTAPPPPIAEHPGQTLFTQYRKVDWLLRQAAIVQLPSAGTLATLRALPPGDATRKAFIGFGDPWFKPQEGTVAALGAAAAVTRGVHLRAAPRTEGLASAEIGQLPRLADTAEEVEDVARVLGADPTNDVFLGPRADERAVRTLKLDDRRIVMFATHGLIPGDLDGLLQPALALSAPTVAGVQGDGLLTMDKVSGLKLNADWVVLSACNTASGDGAGAEALSGLGRAFFYAGTRSLLATNWAVETNSARLLTTNLFRRQATERTITRAEALRQTMLALIDGDGPKNADGQILFSYSHPLFWAPFSLYGDPG